MITKNFKLDEYSRCKASILPGSARRTVTAAMLAVVLVSGLAGIAQERPVPKIYEAYPDPIQNRLQKRLAALQQVKPSKLNDFRTQALVTLLSRWTTTGTTSVITVAFKGGDPVAHAGIARAVSEWTNYGNVTFDFGYDPTTGTFRQWAPTNSRYNAEVRVSFDQKGYWSCVGNQSIDPSLTGPGEASLNLEGFDTNRPSQWTNIVLHEFGHALGFEHEHQNPAGGCETEFRWDDDPGYMETHDQYGQFIPDINGKRPGIYTFLGGPLNNWSRDKIDFNLRSLPNSRAVPVGPFDKKSIMEYHFDQWMYKNGTNSPCYSEENLYLSPGDKAAVAYLFPWQQQAMKQAHEDQRSLLMEFLDSSTAAVKAQGELEQHLMRIQKE